MNRKSYLIFILYFLVIELYAQKIQGIYLSANDFTNDKLSFQKIKGVKCKIKLHTLSYKPYIKIQYTDSVFEFKKDSIFGYKDCNEIAYRFFDEKILTILNPKEHILLYKYEYTLGGKYPETVVIYYFSKKVSADVHLLSIKNLENSFAENKIFTNYIELYFKDDFELIEYDYIHHKYKLNRLQELSLKNN